MQFQMQSLVSTGFEEQIKAAVSRKLSELESITPGAESGRILSFDDPQDAQSALLEGFNEIAMVCGLHYFISSPAAALEQLVIAAKNRGESPSRLINSVLNNFLVSYITPQTTDKAMFIHGELQTLRSEVEIIRKSPPASAQGK